MSASFEPVEDAVDVGAGDAWDEEEDEAAVELEVALEGDCVTVVLDDALELAVAVAELDAAVDEDRTITLREVELALVVEADAEALVDEADTDVLVVDAVTAEVVSWMMVDEESGAEDDEDDTPVLVVEPLAVLDEGAAVTVTELLDEAEVDRVTVAELDTEVDVVEALALVLVTVAEEEEEVLETVALVEVSPPADVVWVLWLVLVVPG